MRREIEIEITPTPEELAEAFAKMDSEQQALFFSALDGESKKWTDLGGWPMQLQYVTESENLTLNGRYMMELIGEYAAPQTEAS